MKRTFLVDLEVGSDTDFLGIAEEISQALLEKGFDVLSVRPWKSSMDPAAATILPPIQQSQPPLPPPSPLS